MVKNIDYSKTIIYKITCKDDNIGHIYIGSTSKSLQERYIKHKYDYGKKISRKIYETIRNTIYYFKLRDKVHLLVRGFSFGFITKAGLENGAFLIGKQRVGKGILGSEDYAIGGEDGNMAYTLINNGGLVLPAKGSSARVWTSDRRLIYDGGFINTIKIRIKKYFFKSKK